MVPSEELGQAVHSETLECITIPCGTPNISSLVSNQFSLQTPLRSITGLQDSRELETTLPGEALVWARAGCPGWCLVYLDGFPLSSSCSGVTFPCQVCNINRKGVIEAPNYRLSLFVWQDSEP